jgi:nitroimidazol reductase NimA-like FMN-containing flavoprotein (pyridoxamine 5'-phosphate oxidase superfamily)
MTGVKLPRMSEDEINNLVEEKFLCRIAFKGDTYPYIAPFQYSVIDGVIYFHFTEYGKKMNFFKQGTPVCVEIEEYTANLSEYRFVVLTGKLKQVDGAQERKKALEKLAEQGKRKLSRNFLVAHGFSKDSEWSTLSADKPILVVKLDEITGKMGLKSP